MIRYNIKLLLRNKILWAWPVIAVLLALIGGIWAEIQSAGNSYSFLMSFGSSPPFPSGLFIPGLIGFVVLIAIIGIPQHFNKNLEPESAALLLSKPITRTEFFFSEYSAVLAITLFYSFITVIVLAVLLFIEAGIFPFQLYLAILLFIPLYFFFSVFFHSVITHPHPLLLGQCTYRIFGDSLYFRFSNEH